jgi:hypothetical protein
MEGRLNEHFNTKLQGLENGLEGRLVGLENRLAQKMGAMQTELLRVFAATSEDQTIQTAQDVSGSVEP